MRVRVRIELNINEEELDERFDSMWNDTGFEELSRVHPMYNHCECTGDFCGDCIEDILNEVFSEPAVCKLHGYSIEEEDGCYGGKTYMEY